MDKPWQFGEHVVPIYVDEKPFCVWDPEVAQHNRRFIRSLDPDYFHTLVRLIDSAPTDARDQVLATAARTFYCQGLETCLALTFAGLQAPQAVFAWMEKYEVGDVISLIEKLEAGVAFKNQCVTPPSSWIDVVAFYCQLMPKTLTASDGTLVERAQVESSLVHAIEQMADEFVAPETRSEYNAVKHGLRGIGGAGTIAITPENAEGIDTASFFLQGPKTGLTLLKVEPEAGRKWNLRVHQHSRNWDLAQACHRLQFAAMWMGCVKSGLRALAGDVEPPIHWNWVNDPDAALHAWGPIHGTYQAHFFADDFKIPAFATKEWIAEQYDAPRKARTASKQE